MDEIESTGVITTNVFDHYPCMHWKDVQLTQYVSQLLVPKLTIEYESIWLTE